jgi:hypothetical protein
MRRGWREILVVSLVFLLGTTVPAARSGAAAGMRGEAHVGLTIDLRWSAAPGQADNQALAAPSPISDGLTLSLSDGEITEMIPWPADGSAGSPFKNADGAWMIGHLTTSRVRARLEVPLSAEIIARRGEHSIRIPVSAVLERPQNAPAQAPFSISVERLPWDSLMVDFGQGAETGIVAPATDVPVAVKYNLLWPEVSEIAVRTTAVLRPMNGTEVLWKEEYREVVAANQLELVARTLNVPSPRAEGSYVLELSSSWEPSGGRESSTRIGRLIRRRKPSPVVASATRRLVLAVVDAKEKGPGGIPEGTAKETEVDSLDLGRIRTARYNAWGRSPVIMPPRHVWGIPAEIIQDAGKKDRDRLKNWIPRTVAETGSLGPADGEGLAWSAVGLRIPHPDKPHRITLTVTGGDPSSLGVAIVDPGGTGRKPRILLDACASGPPVLANGPPVTFSYLVWPDTSEPLLVVLNRNASGPVRLGSVKVAEVESIAARTPIRTPNTPETRTIGVYLAGPNALDRFGGSGEAGLADSLEAARNLVSYLTYCGSSLAVLPERMADRQTRRALHGQADEDATGPDQFEIALRLLKRQGYLAWLAMNLSGTEPLPGLPPPGSPEALQRGLVRVDRNGLADGPCYNPLNAEVRAALKRRLEEAVAPPEGVPRVSGILLRLGSGPTLLGSPDTGIDDETFTRFVRETFGPGGSDGIPGLGHDDPERFAARAQ